MGTLDPEIQPHTRTVKFEDLTENQQEAALKVLVPLGLDPPECKFGVGTSIYKKVMENEGQLKLFQGEEE